MTRPDIEDTTPAPSPTNHPPATAHRPAQPTAIFEIEGELIRLGTAEKLLRTVANSEIMVEGEVLLPICDLIDAAYAKIMTHLQRLAAERRDIDARHEAELAAACRSRAAPGSEAEVERVGAVRDFLRAWAVMALGHLDNPAPEAAASIAGAAP